MSTFIVSRSSLLARGIAVLLLLALFGIFPALPAYAATITVAAGEVVIAANSLCSLREAIINANNDAATHADCVAGAGADTIQLALASTYNVPNSHANADGPTGLPSVATTIVIQGNGSTIQRSGTANYRLFHVASTGNLTLQDLTVSRGAIRGFDAGAGSRSTGGGGAAGLGGAIYNRGSLTTIQAIFNNNSAMGGNGGFGDTSTGNGGGGGGGVESIGGNGGPGTGGMGGGPNGGIPNGGAGGDGGGGAGRCCAGGSTGGAGGFGGGGGGGFNGANNPGAPGGFGGGGGGGGRTGGAGGAAGFGGGNGVTMNGGGGGGMGGAIFNRGGTVTITNSIFSSNTATGGIGTNSGSGRGGALFNRNGTVTTNNATFANNTANNGGGGIYNLGDATTATLTLRNSIVANTPSGTDCTNNIINGGTTSLTGTNNLIESNSGCPGVTVTSDPSFCTFALTSSSPAINAGDNATCEATDLRGVTRPQNTTCDIGAYEFRSGLDDHTYVWDGGGGDSNWSTAANWDNDTTHLAGDTVVFNTTSTSDATITAGGPGYGGAAGWLCSVSVNTGYTGAITMTRALQVNDYAQDDGTFTLNDTLTVFNTMTHTGGKLQETRAVNNANVAFLQIENGSGTVKYRGVNVNTTFSTANLGNVTVVVRAIDIGAGEYCTDTGAGSPAYAERCYSITPTINGAGRVRLWALTASELNGIPQANLSVYRNTVPTWTELTANRFTGSDGGSYSYAEGDTPGFSNFLLGQTGLTPTAVSLHAVTAEQTMPVVLLGSMLLLLLGSVLVVVRRQR